MNSDFLNKNITSILAILWSIFAFVILMVVLTKDIQSDDKTVYLIIGGVFGIINFVIGYYYGASKSKPVDLDKNTTTNQISLTTEKTETK